MITILTLQKNAWKKQKKESETMEEINCLDCIHITSDNFDCEKYCGAKHGWCEYEKIGE